MSSHSQNKLNSNMPYIKEYRQTVTIPAKGKTEVLIDITPKKDGYQIALWCVAMGSGDIISTDVSSFSNTKLQVICKSEYGASLDRILIVRVLYLPM